MEAAKDMQELESYLELEDQYVRLFDTLAERCI